MRSILIIFKGGIRNLKFRLNAIDGDLRPATNPVS